MAVSRRLRFEVLRRDNYACRYCGATAPEAALTVDHVVPVTLGGSDEPSNLVAACVACNAGKSSIAPDASIVENVSEDAIRWAKAMEEARRLQSVQWEAVNHAIQTVEEWWCDWEKDFGHEIPRPSDWQRSISRFVELRLELGRIIDAVDSAMRKPRVIPSQRWRYFCGICWGVLKERLEIASGLIQTEEVE